MKVLPVPCLEDNYAYLYESAHNPTPLHPFLACSFPRSVPGFEFLAVLCFSLESWMRAPRRRLPLTRWSRRRFSRRPARSARTSTVSSPPTTTGIPSPPSRPPSLRCSSAYLLLSLLGPQYSLELEHSKYQFIAS
jgi:hypothetical protein